jgi:hypothetical protein
MEGDNPSLPPGPMDLSAPDHLVDGLADDIPQATDTTPDGPSDRSEPGPAAVPMAERLLAEHEALTIAMHEGPVQNFTMLGIRLERARAQLARGEVAETERALSHLQLALAHEISALRRMLGPRRY